ncbi:MAG: RcnB family protein [Burkholderiaceae bacterium]
MHARRILAVTAMAFGLNAGLAHAQPQERGDREPRHEQQRQNTPSREVQQPGRQAGPQHAQGRPPVRQADRGRGAGPEQRFHRGDRLPSDYRSKQFVVEDWRGHRLSAPPRGHRWVQVGADYVLIAIATGVIAQIVLSH